MSTTEYYEFSLQTFNLLDSMTFFPFKNTILINNITSVKDEEYWIIADRQTLLHNYPSYAETHKKENAKYSDI